MTFFDNVAAAVTERNVPFSLFSRGVRTKEHFSTKWEDNYPIFIFSNHDFLHRWNHQLGIHPFLLLLVLFLLKIQCRFDNDADADDDDDDDDDGDHVFFVK
jgi:hypothetical protein